MCCYVHSCRTPVSLDMVWAFCREDIAGWRDVYRYVDKLGSLVTEYDGSFVDSVQDHFTPRSTIVADAVMRGVAPAGLKRVLLHFHRAVSPLRICRYDVFKRKAYDAKVAYRAFADTDEGKGFYEFIYARDRSPYVLQQGALYLSRKRRAREAFEWIDKAVTDTGGKVWSIRNSHAVILFRANIGADGEGEVIRRTLQQSMKILADCYKYDRRKPYHAAVFSEQALDYWDRYGDETAKDYLQTAQRWLEAEVERSPWHRNVRRLKKVVTRKLERME